ncbi:MAG: FAD:protein FMN transferase [bacterium]|nr:FAD:protein FMN transferase [bacterium]
MKRLLPPMLILAGLAPQASPAGPESGSVVPLVTIPRQGVAMGTSWSLSIRGSGRSATLAASEQIVRELELGEQRLSNWLPNSELSRWNRVQPGRHLPCDQTLIGELRRAEHWRKVTGGAFSHLAEPLVRAWDLRGQGRIPTATAISEALAACDPMGLSWQGGQPLRHKATKVASGAFGKGAAMDAAFANLGAKDSPSVALNLGGQLLVHGFTETIDIAHPQHREQTVATWTIDSGSLATSGNSERGLLIDGRRYSHILDARTGQPAEDFGSVTVWCDKAIDADCLSTALFVLGPDEGLRLAATLPTVRVLFIENTSVGLLLRASPNCKPQLQSTLPIQWFEESPKDQTSPSKPARTSK